MNLSELSGADLDHWVAKALERDLELTGQDKHGAPMLAGRRSLSHLIEKYREFPQVWSPSTNWQDAASILVELYGPDFLVKSMRSFVEMRFDA
jgi:hypothetical protein